MQLKKNKTEALLSLLKHMPENFNVDIEQEQRTFFNNLKLQKKKRFGFNNHYIKYAMVLILAVIPITAYYINSSSFKNTATELQVKTVVPYGNTSKVVFPDGSSVWLNAGSKITYNNFYKNDSRTVMLDGEGYFDIVKSNKPFIVNTKKNIQIQVLGTTFNLKAYTEDDVVETALITGNIQLKIDGNLSKKKIDMVAGEKVIYKKNTQEIYVKNELNIADEKEWVNGKLIFKGDSLKTIAQELERAYNTKIDVDEEAKKNIITASFNKKTPINEIFELLKIASNFNYKLKNNTWIITTSN